jgi:hypothetical protein
MPLSYVLHSGNGDSPPKSGWKKVKQGLSPVPQVCCQLLALALDSGSYVWFMIGVCAVCRVVCCVLCAMSRLASQFTD